MSEFDDIARELHATRAEPSREFARELDRRAAEWLRRSPRRWVLPSPRIAIPALASAAAAAVVIALVVSGGDGGGAELEVAVVPDKGAVEALGGVREAPQAGAPQRDSAARAEGGLSAPTATRVDEGEPVTLRYFFTAPTEGTVEFAGRHAELELAAGAGRLEITTEGLPEGRHLLEIALPAAPLYRERIEIGR